MSEKNELSNKAKENLRRNEDLRRKNSKWIKLQAVEKTTMHFDPEKIEPGESEFNGRKTQRYQYTVSNDLEDEKYFTVSKRTSEVIDTYLAQRQSILTIQRVGSGKETQYIITPIA
jgi:hypothetical protein